jgi:putative DNA primase/helicase
MSHDGAEAIRDIIGLAEDVRPRLRLLTAAEFLALDLPPRRMILNPWLPEKGLAMIYSPRGTGKTLLALTTAYANATGSSSSTSKLRARVGS